MLKRSIELRDKHGNNWYPLFSNKSISRDTQTNPELIEATTTNLTGIICESYMMKAMRVWQKRYFLPSAKFGAARSLLT